MGVVEFICVLTKEINKLNGLLC